MTLDHDGNNCWNCKWVGSVPGSAHKCCIHPLTQTKTIQDPTVKLMGMLGTKVSMLPDKLGIKYDEYGFKKGWVVFPHNFDPTWIRECNGWKPQ